MPPLTVRLPLKVLLPVKSTEPVPARMRPAAEPKEFLTTLETMRLVGAKPEVVIVRSLPANSQVEFEIVGT